MKASVVTLVVLVTLGSSSGPSSGQRLGAGDAEFQIDPGTESFVAACLNALPTPAGYCPIHRCPLIPGCTSVVYGLPVSPDTSTERYLRTAVFPYSRRVQYESGVAAPPGNHEAEVMFCPHCRSAEVSWGQYQWRLAHSRGER